VELEHGALWSSDGNEFYGVWRGITLFSGLAKILESILVAWNRNGAYAPLATVAQFKSFGALEYIW